MKIKLAIIFCLITIISFVQLRNLCLAQDIVEPAADTEWKTIKSKYCTITYHPEVTLNRVNKRIGIRFYDVASAKDRRIWKDMSTEEQLANKFDSIFKKVEKILDMYPRKIHLKIKIYKDKEQLNEEIAQVAFLADRRGVTSCYIHKYTTIYLNERSIQQYILAHEMAHAIIDHYFLVVPPARVGELLAQYVEIHLED